MFGTSAGPAPSELWVEGISAYAGGSGQVTFQYITPLGGELSPSVWIPFTVLDVDMDMDGVKDDDDLYGEVTEEIMPGGFIPLGEVLELELRPVQPTTQTGSVTLCALAGGDKIRIWDNEQMQGDPLTLPATFATPTQLPKNLWVEGYELSSSCDPDVELELTFEVAGSVFRDKINVTVVDLCTCPPDPGTATYWETFLPYFYCPPEEGQSNQKCKHDHCDNRLAVYCDCDNSGAFMAYSWWYKPSGVPPRGTEVGICVWEGGVNDFRYKATYESIYGVMRFIATKHTTQNEAEGVDGQGEGCDDYWCWRVERHDCVNNTPVENSPWWRRHPNYSAWDEDDGEPCPGPPGKHHCYPN